ESVLSQGGYRVVTANRRPIVLAKARELRPDAIILDLSLGVSLHGPAGDGFGLCRALRADSAVSPATPIVVTTAGPALRALQLEALRAGNRCSSRRAAGAAHDRSCHANRGGEAPLRSGCGGRYGVLRHPPPSAVAIRTAGARARGVELGTRTRAAGARRA